jgi:hypothetical protein
VGIHATVKEVGDFKFAGVFADESVKLGFTPDEHGVVVLSRVDVARIFAHCHSRTHQMTINDYYRMFLVKAWIDSGREQLIFA